MNVTFYTTITENGVVTREAKDGETLLGVILKIPAGEGNTAKHIISPEFLKHYGKKYSAELRGDKVTVGEPDPLKKFEKKKVPRKTTRHVRKKVERRT